MSHEGSCHCGNIKFQANGECESVVECNCSHCSRKGYLLWFLPKDNVFVQAQEGSLSTYTFNTHTIKHHFCSNCGCAPFGFGEHNGIEMAAINARCLTDLDLSKVKREFVDGRSL